MKPNSNSPTATAAGSRFVGIQHRVKVTKEGEARPTVVQIRLADGSTDSYPLKTEQDELDWVYGRFPLSWRKVKPDEDLTAFPEWHIQRDSKTELPTKVPASYDGLREGDLVGMVLGGSGDYFAFALAKRAEKVNAGVRRVAPFKLEAARGLGKKADDAALIARLAAEQPDLFEVAKPLGVAISRLRVSYRLWQDAMMARIAAGNRFSSAFIGRTFLEAGEMPPEQSLTKLADEAKARDPGLLALQKEEDQKLRQVEKDLEHCEIWTELFEPIKGVGPSIGARIIAGVITISRFAEASKLRAYCGVHVLGDGTFARRKNGCLANWSGDIRQGLWLLGDQFNRRPDTPWGVRLRENKAMYHGRHPHPALKVKVGEDADQKPIFEVFTLEPGKCRPVGDDWEIGLPDDPRKVSGRLMFTPAHLLKRALWRTITEFVDWLYDAWWAIEEGKKAPTPEEWLATKAHRGIAPPRVLKEKKPKKGDKKAPETSAVQEKMAA